MALFSQPAGVQCDAVHVKLRNKHAAGVTAKNARVSKVTSMIELFGNTGDADKTKIKPAARNALTTPRSTNQETINSSEHNTTGKRVSPVRRISSGISLELQTPKPFVPDKPTSLSRTARTAEDSDKVLTPKPNGHIAQDRIKSKPQLRSTAKVTPPTARDTEKMLPPRPNGHATQDRITSKPQLLVNGSTRLDSDADSQSEIQNPTTKRVSRAFDYWEHKIEPKASPPRGPSPNELKKPSNELKKPSNIQTSLGLYLDGLDSNRMSPKLQDRGKVGGPVADRPRPKSDGAAALRDNTFIKQDKKPDLPTRPRFMTTASGLRRPNPTPFKVGGISRLPSSLHRSPKRDAAAQSSEQGVTKAAPSPAPYQSPKREALMPPTMAALSKDKVNPLPKPQRTFTFNSNTEERPNIAPRLPKRGLARVNSDTSSIESPASTLSSSSSINREYGKFGRQISASTRAPGAGYEEVVLFEPSASANKLQSSNTQKWHRQHNYEDVDDSHLLKGRRFAPNYDRITLDGQTQRRRSLSEIEDDYEHLKFQQDLHKANPVKIPGLTDNITSLKERTKLKKQISDTSVMMTRDTDGLSKSLLSLESGNVKLQITDKIRDAFSTIGKRYRHHKKAYNSVEDDTNYSTSGDEDSDTEMDLNKHKQTLERVRTLQKTYRKTLKYKSLEREMGGIECYKMKIFEQVLISKVVPESKDQDNSSYVSKVVYRFPAPPPGKTMGDEKTLAHFCFPDINELVPCEEMQSQSFSFMLTRENGTRKFGYCRRSLPPGKGPRYPVVYCLISALGSFGLYEKILEELEKRHHESMKNVVVMLDSLVVKNFPAPGRSVTVEIADAEGKRSPVVLRRPFDTRLEHVDLQCLLAELGIENTIKIFASLLLERRVIISGKSLGILTACVHAFQALLYPFVWQHVFVPVLPMPMLDLCCTPTPLLIGILETSVEKLKTLPLEEVFIVNLSTQEVISSVGDELEILPRKFQTALTEALVNHTGACVPRGSGAQPSYNYATDYESAEQNTVISESFMHLFVEMLGHYQNHFQPVDYTTMSPSRHGRILRSFNRVSFYDDVTSRSLRRFLDLFMETQMFDGFIHSREMSGPDYEGLFERRIARHLLTADASHLNFKVIKTKMKKFFNRK